MEGKMVRRRPSRPTRLTPDGPRTSQNPFKTPDHNRRAKKFTGSAYSNRTGTCEPPNGPTGIITAIGGVSPRPTWSLGNGEGDGTERTGREGHAEFSGAEAFGCLTKRILELPVAGRVRAGLGCPSP
jgi:hypothetical protein